MTEYDIQAENMYNTNETGFIMGRAQSRHVIEIICHPRDCNGRMFPVELPELNLRGGQTLQDGSREFVIAICCICIDGTFLNLAIIFKAQDLQDSWFTNMANVPKDILFGVSPNGWTDNSKALAWLERSFGPGSASEKKATTNGTGSLHSGLHGGLHGGSHGGLHSSSHGGSHGSLHGSSDGGSHGGSHSSLHGSLHGSLQPETQAQSPSRKWRLLMSMVTFLMSIKLFSIDV